VKKPKGWARNLKEPVFNWLQLRVYYFSFCWKVKTPNWKTSFISYKEKKETGKSFPRMGKGKEEMIIRKLFWRRRMEEFTGFEDCWMNHGGEEFGCGKNGSEIEEGPKMEWKWIGLQKVGFVEREREREKERRRSSWIGYEKRKKKKKFCFERDMITWSILLVWYTHLLIHHVSCIQ